MLGAATGRQMPWGVTRTRCRPGWTASRGRPDVLARPTPYDRWWPTLFAKYSDDTDAWRGGDVRTREVNAGLLVPFRRVRWSQSVLGAGHRSTGTIRLFDSAGPATALELARARCAAAGASTRRGRSGIRSASKRDGAATVTIELTREALGADAETAARRQLDVRGYLPVVPRHGVLAGRLAARSAWGERAARRIFSASGNASQPGGFAFGSDAIGLLRGWTTAKWSGDTRLSSTSTTASRLMRLERGAGTLPLFARALHGALFVDAANAWDSTFRRDDFRDLDSAPNCLWMPCIGYSLPITLTTGACVGVARKRLCRIRPHRESFLRDADQRETRITKDADHADHAVLQIEGSRGNT